jgi:hypothetical protein
MPIGDKELNAIDLARPATAPSFPLPTTPRLYVFVALLAFLRDL